ncbi:hypothetical protein FOZ62_005683, partial [Perkinsus olseni]
GWVVEYYALFSSTLLHFLMSASARPLKLSGRDSTRNSHHLAAYEQQQTMPDWERNEYRRLIQRICRHHKDIVEPFVNPVPKTVPRYYDVISTPMDIGVIREKLDSFAYSSRAEFEGDIRQMLSNAYLYNNPGEYVFEKALEFHDLFNEQMNATVAVVLDRLAQEEEAITKVKRRKKE